MPVGSKWEIVHVKSEIVQSVIARSDQPEVVRSVLEGLRRAIITRQTIVQGPPVVAQQNKEKGCVVLGQEGRLKAADEEIEKILRQCGELGIPRECQQIVIDNVMLSVFGKDRESVTPLASKLFDPG